MNGAAFKTEPYYVAIVTPAIHGCMGGLAIDTDSAVLGPDGTAIPGLYAAGEVAGGVPAVAALAVGAPPAEAPAEATLAEEAPPAEEPAKAAPAGASRTLGRAAWADMSNDSESQTAAATPRLAGSRTSCRR